MFKIGSAAEELSICLRCRYRLSLKKTVHKDRRQQFQNASLLLFHSRAFTSSPRLHRDEDQIAHKEDTFLPRSNIRYLPIGESTDGDSQLHQKQPLGVQSLGDPAEVLVLREPKQYGKHLGVLFSDERSNPLPPPSLEATSEALLHDIDAARGIMDIGHVCENIDNVKDSFLADYGRGSGNLSPQEYDELVSRLTGGFEKKHLSEYWRRSHFTSNTDALNLRFPYGSAVLARSEWYPDVTSGKHASIPPLKDESSVDQNAKQKKLLLQDKGKQWIAENVIRQCWGLYREQADTIGQIVIRMPPTYLKLLLGHTSEPLKTLSQTYSVVFEANKKTGTICVEADFSTSEVVVRILIQFLERVRFACVSFESLNSKNLKSLPRRPDSVYLKEIQRLTNTVILDRAGRTQNYTIFYLGPEESDLKDAQRLLDSGTNLNSIERKGRLWIQIPVLPTTSAVPMEFGENLPLIARSMQWARFADEDGRKFNTSTRTLNLAEKAPLRKFQYPHLIVNEVFRFLSLRGKTKAHNLEKAGQNWERHVTRWSQVILGQVAFPQRQAQKLEMKLKNAKTNADLTLHGVYKNFADLEKVFVTTVPGMTRALEAASMSSDPAERLQIRMVPESVPGVSEESSSNIPELEITVNVNLKEREVKIKNARLVLEHEQLDLLLPSQAADLRLMKREYLYCNQREVDRYSQQPVDSSLTEFVQASQLDIWGSERLRTPNHLRLSVPAGILTVSQRGLLQGDSIPVDYKFASLEHRSIVNLSPIGAHLPQYITTQAGRTGGRREELAVRLGVPAETSRGRATLNRMTAQGFLEAALSMISAIR